MWPAELSPTVQYDPPVTVEEVKNAVDMNTMRSLRHSTFHWSSDSQVTYKTRPLQMGKGRHPRKPRIAVRGERYMPMTIFDRGTQMQTVASRATGMSTTKHTFVPRLRIIALTLVVVASATWTVMRPILASSDGIHAQPLAGQLAGGPPPPGSCPGTPLPC
jgi:hypothetical protein